MTQPRKYGPWLIHASNEVYRDPWVRVVRDDVTRPDGDPGSYTVVHIKPGVSVLAMDDQDHVYLTREFHYAVGQVTLEVVSGGIEPGQTAIETAKRELKEELGIEAQEWRSLGMVDPFTASMLSPTEMFIAQQLNHGDAAPEGTEQIESVRMPFDEAVDCVMTGRITHAPSCVLILKAANMRLAGGAN